MSVETRTKAIPSKGAKQLLKHIVELDEHGNPKDRVLCGKLWDRVFLPQGGDVCEECLDVLRARGEIQ